MNKPLTFLLLAILSCFLLVNKVQAQHSANHDFYYLLEFEHLDQQGVKPVIGQLMSLFKEVPFLEQGVFNVFYYHTAGEVSLEQVEDILEGQQLSIVRLTAISADTYLEKTKN